MRTEIMLPERMARDLRRHLLSDRTMEQMAVTLCGTSQQRDVLRLLGRHLVLMPAEALTHQSAGRLELKQEVQSYVLRLAASEGLSQVDWHTHGGSGHGVRFSGTDDHNERRLAEYLAERIPGTHYASVVMNDDHAHARIWCTSENGAWPEPVSRIALGALQEQVLDATSCLEEVEERFSRQVQAFGKVFQRRLSRLRVGIVGLGALGSIMVEELTRLGVVHWTLVDDDRIEESNLNRVTGSTLMDARRARSKVAVAMRSILRIAPDAEVTPLEASALRPATLHELTACDLLIACTDNHASRLTLNRVSAQYLIPLLHLGFCIEGKGGQVSEVSGEYAISSPGEWCLLCAGIVDGQAAARELASPQEMEILRQRGYVSDTAAPAVYHLDGVIASVAAAEVHNLVHPYRSSRRYLVYDDLKGELMHLSVEGREGCPVCSPEGVLGLGDLEALPDYERSGDRALSVLMAHLQETEEVGNVKGGDAWRPS